MSPPDPDQNASRPAFAWESVVASDDVNEAADGNDASELGPISLTIAPLSLDPLPPIPSTPPSAIAAADAPPVLGDVHIGLSTIGAPAEPPVAPVVPPASATPPATASPPATATSPESTTPPAPVAPPAPSASAPSVEAPTLPDPGAAPTLAPTPSAPAASATTEPPAPPKIDADTAPGLDLGAAPATDFAPTLPTTGGGYAPRPAAMPAPEVVAEPVEAADDDDAVESDELRIEPMDVPDPSSIDDDAATEVPTASILSGEQPVIDLFDTVVSDEGAEAPTTVLASTGISAPSLPGVGGAAPSNAAEPATASDANGESTSRPGHESAPLTKKERKQQAKAKAKEVKRAGKVKPAKSKKQKPGGTSKSARQAKSGRGGLALFFTLLVLVALIVAAIIFGRPYLFPDDWDVESRPYGEAVEAVTGSTMAEAVVVTRQATGTYAMTMTDELLGEWEQQAPVWRSFGLIDGVAEVPVLRETLAGWTGAYYSPSLGEVIVDDALTPAAVDGAIVQAMSAAALDQEIGWSGQIDDALVATAALTRAEVFSQSAATAAASSFGPAVSERRIDKAEFMPPVLTYRVKAPIVLSEVIGDNTAEVILAESLAAAPAPELLEGDTLIEQREIDRGFWYLVFASYTDAPTAYSATNALVNSSLTTADRAGTVCSYATFSGTDVAGTERVAGVLQEWAAAVPVEMGAAYTALADGTMQLTTCDPGAGFSTGARFGTASELTRWRLVELAAVESVDPVTGTAAARTAAVERVRQSQAAAPLLGLPLDTSPEELAQLARAAAQPAG